MRGTWTAARPDPIEPGSLRELPRDKYAGGTLLVVSVVPSNPVHTATAKLVDVVALHWPIRPKLMKFITAAKDAKLWLYEPRKIA